MADKQTKAQIVADMRAQDAARNQALWQAIKRTPGLLAGGATDTVNLLLGLVTGKGLSGFVKKPIGGGESINEVFGMPQTTNATQNIAEAVMSMASPSGMAKAIILPAAIAGATMKDLKAARTAIQAGKAEEIYKTQKIYEDPVTGELLKVIPDKNASLNLDKFNVTKYWLANDGPQFPSQISYSAYSPQVPLSDVLNHPDLYNLLPNIKETKFSSAIQFPGSGILSEYMQDRSGAFVQGNKYFGPQIAIGPVTGGKSSIDYISTLLHEIQHNIQRETGMPSGGNFGQFLSQPKERYLYAEKFLEELKATNQYATGYAQKVIKDITDEAMLQYKNIPGEVQSQLVQQQFETGDYITHPLKLMKAMGKDIEAMKRAETFTPVDLGEEIKHILDLYAPLPRKSSK